jgi:hypothetical protein
MRFICFLATLSSAAALGCGLFGLTSDKFGSGAWREKLTGTSDQLGPALERDFRLFTDRCSLLTEDGKSSIPADVVPELAPKRLLDPSQRVVTFDRDSMASLFRNALSKAEREDMGRLDPKHQLPLESLGSAKILPVLAPKPGRSDLAYTHTCSGYLSAQANGNVGIPVASVKAALSASAKSETTTVLVAGTFVSPIEFALNGGGDPTPVLSELWRVYEQSPDLAAEAYFLQSFDGIATFTTGSTSRSAKFDIQASAGGGTPVASGSFALAAGFAEQSNFEFSDYATYVLSDSGGHVPSTSFGRLPSATEVARRLASARRIYGPTSQPNYLREMQLHAHYFDVPGLTKSMCRQDDWALKVDPGGALLPKYTTGSVDWRAADKVCRFTVTGYPDADKLVEDLGAVSYGFERNSTIAGASKLVLRSENITFNTSREPLVSAVVASPATFYPDDSAGAGHAQWTVTVSLVGSISPVAEPNPAPRIEGDKADVSCAGRPNSTGKAAVQYDASTHRFSILISVPGSEGKKMADFDWNNTDACQGVVQLSVLLDSRGGGTSATSPRVKRTLNVQMAAPRNAAKAGILVVPASPGS